ncbi:VV20781 family protein [Tsuneonella sp. HG249]
MPRALIPIACLALTGCTAAQMQLPAGMASSAMRTEFVGIGGWPGGKFVAGPYSGDFARSLDSISFSDASITRAGHGEFTISGPGIAAAVAGRCTMRADGVDLGLAEVTLKPMAYRCNLQSSADTPGRLELRETVGGGTAMTRYERHGEIHLGGESLRFRSVHHISGTPMPSFTPVGYVFERGGGQVAALELTGRPTLITPAALDSATAQAVHVAAIALAIFWDPAVHDAGS